MNKERARAGEAREASKGSGGRTYAQLRNEAADRAIKGRSTMNKAQLERALDR